MRKIILILLALTLIAGLAGCGGNSSESQKSTSLATSGSDVILSKATLVATSKESLDKLTTLAGANNIDAIQRMLDSKEAVSLEAGTKVTVIKRDFSTADIEVATGTYKGTKGMLPVELLK